MEKSKILKALNPIESDELKNILCEIINTYSIPSFGSMSKHDIDLLLFDSLVTLGIVKSNPSIYDVMRDLKVTRSKARSLIYEYQLRKIQNETQLIEQLREVLKSPLMSKQSDFVYIEVDNPYLIDFIRKELKVLGFVTDGTFHAELVKMSTKAFAELYEKTLSEDSKKEIKKKLVALRVKPDISLGKILPHLIVGVGKTIAKTTMGKIGDDIADQCVNYLESHFEELKTKIGDMLKDDIEEK